MAASHHARHPVFHHDGKFRPFYLPFHMPLPACPHIRTRHSKDNDARKPRREV
jgi:hypothetical protein